MYLRKILMLIYYKWIKRACPHFCFFCEFKDVCYNDGLDDRIEMLKYYINNDLN